MSLLLTDSVVGLFFQVVPISLLMALLYSAVRHLLRKNRGLPTVWHAELLRILFVCYITGLVNLVLVPPNFWGNLWYCLLTADWNHWVPPRLFDGYFALIPTFVRYLTGEFAGSPGTWVTTMLVGNLLMLLPMGLFLPTLFPRLRGRRMLLACVAVPLTIELLQPVVSRSFDTDDLIVNFLGMAAGWGLVTLLRDLRKTR